MNVSEYIAEFLFSIGIKHLFTVPGGGSIFLNDSILSQGKIKLIANHHEQASALCAEGYSRIRNDISACLVTSGPGGTNALTGVTCSYQDSVPVFFISGNVRTNLSTQYLNSKLRQLGDQELNIIDLVKHITKAAVQVDDPEKLPEILNHLYNTAISGRPGPVWLDVPLDIQRSVVSLKNVQFIKKENNKNLLSSKSENNIYNLLEKSKKPLIWAGYGIRLIKHVEQFRILIEKYSLPTVTSFNAIDLLPSDHELNFGRPGILGQIRANKIVQECDLLIVIGSRLYVRQIGYNKNSFAKNAKIIYCDVDNHELNKNTIRTNLKIHTSADVFINTLNELLSQLKGSFVDKKWIEQCQNISNNNPIYLPRHLDKHPLSSYCVIGMIGEKIPSDYNVVFSDGTANVAGSQIFPIKDGMRVFSNKGTAPMGYGLPAAIGASFANEYGKILCIEGDGSIMLNIQELQTVRYHNLPIKIVLLSNGGYNSIRITQKNLCDGRYSLINESTGISFPSFNKVAEAFEIKHTSVNTLSELTNAIEKMFVRNCPEIIEIFVDNKELHEPKIVTRTDDQGRFISSDFGDIDWLSE